MARRRILPQLGSVTLLGAALAGCTGDAGRRAYTPTQPAMPTMAAASASAATESPESEIVRTALRLARNHDPVASVAVLNSIGDPARRGELGVQLVTSMVEQDPSAAAALATALPQGPGYTPAIEIAARAMARRDPDGALRWAFSLADAATGRVARHVVTQELALADPRATIDRVRARPAGPLRDDTLIVAVAAWARREPDDALAWLRDQPDDELRRRLTSGVGFEIAQRRPERAVAVAEMLPAGRDRWLLFSAIAQTWVAVDSKAALAWAGQLPAGAARDAARAGIDTGFGIPASRRLAGGPGTGGARRTRGGGAAIAAVPEGSSPAFAAWLATQAPGMSHDEAVLEYVRQRGALEPGAMGPWIAALPGGPTRDRALELYVEGLLIGSPSEAARWVQSLPRSQRSDEMIEKAARRWLQTNPDAAAGWLDSTLLPPDRKERLLREVGR